MNVYKQFNKYMSVYKQFKMQKLIKNSSKHKLNNQIWKSGRLNMKNQLNKL